MFRDINEFFKDMTLAINKFIRHVWLSLFLLSIPLNLQNQSPPPLHFSHNRHYFLNGHIENWILKELYVINDKEINKRNNQIEVLGTSSPSHRQIRVVEKGFFWGGGGYVKIFGYIWLHFKYNSTCLIIYWKQN